MPEPVLFRLVRSSSTTPKPTLPKNSPLSCLEQSKLDGQVQRFYQLATRDPLAATLALEWGEKILRLFKV